MAEAPRADAALVLEDLGKAFRSGARVIQALDGVSLAVEPGKVTGLIGPDGAGKTTLMRLAAALLRPDVGSIRVLGMDVARAPLQVQSAIGYMPQRFGLYEDLSVRENLDLYADLQGVPAAQRPERYAQLLRMVGLTRFTGRLAGRLSGGMKQKLGLACTLVRPPRLLLLDEPTVGVDPVSRRELWAITYRLVRDEGMSVLLSTAYLDEAQRCDAVILLHQGRLLGQGPPAEFSRPLAGHSFLVKVDGLSKRSLQTRLAGLPGVVDAIIQGERVRVVMREAKPPDLAALEVATKAAPQLLQTPLSPRERAGERETVIPPETAISRGGAGAMNVGQQSAEVCPVDPTFEDAFVSRLRAGPAASAPEAPPMPAPAAPAGDGAVISVAGVKRRFGDFYAVKGVSFEVHRGEVFGLLGANGAGKTTTFRMLCGLLPASEGHLQVAGHDLRRAAAGARGHIGYMAQRFSQYVNLTVEQNLSFFASAYGLRRSARRERIRWALAGFDLERYADMASGDLPLGYKQRLAMAAALMHEPDILFLDEPTSGVDPLARREFWHRINLLAEQGVTVLVTTHFMEEANYCDRLLIMADGETLAQGTPAEMKMRFRSRELPDPTMEDAFIGLMEQRSGGAGEAGR